MHIQVWVRWAYDENCMELNEIIWNYMELLHSLPEQLDDAMTDHWGRLFEIARILMKANWGTPVCVALRWGVPKMGVPQITMAFNTKIVWFFDDRGYPYFRKPTDVFLRFCVLFLVPGIWEDRDCCHFLHHTISITLGGGVGVGGVGWGGIITSLARPHIRDATLLYALLHFIHIHTYVMLRCCRFSCTSTHTSCYAAVGSLALPHIRHATLL